MSRPEEGQGEENARDSETARLLKRLGRREPESSLEGGGQADGDNPSDPTGRYRFMAEIGRGGVGVVYRGRDQDLGRDVAMKVLRPEHANRQEILDRFVEEAQIGGQLQHPGIVPVYEMGLQHGDQPYFAMKLVKGETLADLLERRSEPGQERRRFLGYFEQICQTMAYAHAKQVVHRDLKPQNVMVGSFGEVQVVDWGLAKVLKDDGKDEAHAARTPSASEIATVRSSPDHESQSLVGSMMGTPEYMPPEQAHGDVERMDQRSDVFGLGAVLCEVLTGRPPYTIEHGDLIVQAARAALEPAFERLEGCGADETLIELTRQCLAPAREARPNSAQEVADVMAEYLSAVEERARDAKVKAAAARVRARATLALSIVILLLLATATGWYLFVQSETQARRDAAERRVASALNEASVRLGLARAGGIGDLELWSRVEDAVANAQSLAAEADVGEPQKREVGELATLVEAETKLASAAAQTLARDSQMTESLLSIQIPADDDLGTDGYLLQEAARRNGAYAEAFEQYLMGRDLTRLPASEAVVALTGPIQRELADAIDLWVLARRFLERREVPEAPNAEATSTLLSVAMALDPDPWRQRLRVQTSDPAADREALRALASTAELETLSVSNLSLLGNALVRADARTEAIEVLEIACDRFPDHFSTALQLSILHERESNWQSSEDTLRVARALRPDILEVRHRMAMMAGRLGRIEDEKTAFEKLREEDPDNPHWVYHLAFCAQRMGRKEEAITLYRQSLELEADNSAAWLNLGTVLNDVDRNEEAEKCFRDGLSLHPESARLHNNLGNLLHELGQLKSAAESLERAIQLDPDSAEPYLNLGMALAEMRELKGAREKLEKAVELAPDDARFLGALAQVQLMGGNPFLARTTFEKALAIDPDDRGSNSGYGKLLAAMGDLPGATPHFRKAAEASGADPAFRIDLGAILVAQSRFTEAVEVLSKAVQDSPDLGPGHFNLGRALRGAGMPIRALKSLKRAEEIWTGDSDPFARRWLGVVKQDIAALQDEADRTRELLASARKETDSLEPSALVEAGSILLRRGEAAVAAKAFSVAFAKRPTLATESVHRLPAARAAALVSLGTEPNSSNTDPEALSRYRALALAWFQAEAEHVDSLLSESPPSTTKAREALNGILRSRAVPAIWTDARLDELEPSEARAWRRLRRHVTDLNEDIGDAR